MVLLWRWASLLLDVWSFGGIVMALAHSTTEEVLFLSLMTLVQSQFLEFDDDREKNDYWTIWRLWDFFGTLRNKICPFSTFLVLVTFRQLSCSSKKLQVRPVFMVGVTPQASDQQLQDQWTESYLQKRSPTIRAHASVTVLSLVTECRVCWELKFISRTCTYTSNSVDRNS